MKTGLALAIWIVATFSPQSAHAEKKRQREAEPAAAVTKSGAPSERIEPLLEPCLDAILAPLETEPRMPRVEVEKLRSSFAAGQVKAKTPSQKQIYQYAMAVTESLTSGMDARVKAKSDAMASAKVPSISSASGNVKSSPMRGVDAGANAEAIRKKQLDERRYSDKEARARSEFVGSMGYKAWTDKAPTLRQNVMGLYTKLVQLEAAEPAVEAAVAKPAPPVQKPAPPPEQPAPVVANAAKKGYPAGDAGYVGTWKSASSGYTYFIKAGHTASRTMADGSTGVGTWKLEENGQLLVIDWGSNGKAYRGKLSADGKLLHMPGRTALKREMP